MGEKRHFDWSWIARWRESSNKRISTNICYLGYQKGSVGNW